MSIDHNNLLNIINHMDFSEIRNVCLFNNNYNKLCRHDEQIKKMIDKKLNDTIDSILNKMEVREGVINLDYMKVYHAPFNTTDKVYDGHFNYKYIQIRSLVPNHTFELYDNYDPLWVDEMNETRKKRFELVESISGIKYCIESLLSVKSGVSETIHQRVFSDNIEIRKKCDLVLNFVFVCICN